MQEIPNNLKRKFSLKMDELSKTSLSVFGINISGLKLSYKLKGQRAGIIFPANKEIRLNAELCLKFPDKMTNEVLTHEVAHYIAFLIYPDSKPHGKEWKYIAKTFGMVNPAATHNMPTTKAKNLKRFTYKCGCSTYTLSSIRHNRIRRKKAQYNCKYCGEKLSKKDIIQ